MAAGIIIAVILIGCAVHGLFQGGVRILWSIGILFIGIILGTVFNPIMTNFLNEQVHLDTYIEQTIDAKLSLSMRNDLNSETTEIQKAYINELKIPSTWKKALIKKNTTNNWVDMAVDSFTEYLTKMIAQICVKTISFILTFLLVVIVLGAGSVLLGIVDKLPLLREVNKVVGGFLGLVQGFLIIAFMMVVISFGKNYSWGSYLYDMVAQNGFALFLYKHNLIFWILSSVF